MPKRQAKRPAKRAGKAKAAPERIVPVAEMTQAEVPGVSMAFFVGETPDGPARMVRPLKGNAAVARYLGLSPRTLEKWAEGGGLDAARLADGTYDLDALGLLLLARAKRRGERPPVPDHCRVHVERCVAAACREFGRFIAGKRLDGESSGMAAEGLIGRVLDLIDGVAALPVAPEGRTRSLVGLCRQTGMSWRGLLELAAADGERFELPEDLIAKARRASGAT
jgi:hypothetical protein